jgi:hypothetical protein
MSFRATLELHGKTATGIEVPDDVVVALGRGRKPAVTATLNGYSYRTTVAVMGGRNLIPVSAEHRDAAGLTAGDQVEVDLVLDTAPRTVDVPAELAEALDGAPKKKAAFEKASYSRQRQWALSVDGAKTDETRQRRIAKVLDELGA